MASEANDTYTTNNIAHDVDDTHRTITTEHENQRSASLPSWFVVQLTFTASLGGCLFGYDMGAISGTLPQLTNTFDLNDRQEELVVSILYVGGAVGALIGGSLCDRFGRKRTIILTDIVFIVGALVLFFASAYPVVVGGRFVVGIGVAVSGIADVSYLHECSPIEWRGSIVSVNEACISLGFLLAYIAGYVFADEGDEEWRVVFGVAGILAFIQCIGMSVLPESPAWLTEKGNVDAANRALDRINGTNNRIITNQIECNESLDDVVEEPEIMHTPFKPSRCSGLRSKVYSVKITLSRYRHQVYIALFLAVAQQICGQTNILSYAPLIFAEVMGGESNTNDDDNGTDETKDTSMIIIGSVKFFVTVIVIWRIEYIGRRLLLIVGNLLIALGLMALVIAFGGSNTTVSLDDDTEDTTTSWSPLTNIKTFHLALPGVLLVVCGYSMSFGPLTWLLTSEIFPTEIRGRALGYSTIISYMCGALSTQTFLWSQSILGPSFVFGIYCIVTIAGVLFAYLAIPETGGKTVEQIDESLNQMYWWKYSAIALSQNDDNCMEDMPVFVSSTEMVQNPSQLSARNFV